MYDRKEVVKMLVDYIEKHQMNLEDINDLLDNIRLDVLEEQMGNKEGQFVLKKSGDLEAYNQEKLEYSLQGASRDARADMNASDIRIIRKAVMSHFNGKKVFTADQLRAAVAEELLKNGYKRVYASYLTY